MTGMGAYDSAHAYDPIGAAEGTDRVLRGGSWGVNARIVRAACREQVRACGSLPVHRLSVIPRSIDSTPSKFSKTCRLARRGIGGQLEPILGNPSSLSFHSWFIGVLN